LVLGQKCSSSRSVSEPVEDIRFFYTNTERYLLGKRTGVWGKAPKYFKFKKIILTKYNCLGIY
ncbi:hypothetical protein, partial [Brachyspira pulli]|uniref:hypothetical protein n=1 Tax=Brachyspira pulli TaxID=310721 RepID=UPI003004803D